ncbi:hypothetical protein MTO96_032094 [Rhipicephalus appendiculatus]
MGTLPRRMSCLPEARHVDCVMVQAEGTEDAVGWCTDEGVENVNDEQYTAMDKEITGKEAEKFRGAEEETDGVWNKRAGSRHCWRGGERHV